MHRPTKDKEITIDTPRADAETLTMPVDSEASGHYFDEEFRPDLKDKKTSYKTLEKTHKGDPAGRHVLLRIATPLAVSWEMTYRNSDACRTLNTDTRRVTESRNVVFVETPASTQTK